MTTKLQLIIIIIIIITIIIINVYIICNLLIIPTPYLSVFLKFLAVSLGDKCRFSLTFLRKE